MYCRGCRYDLRHLPETRCPECGRGFDPQDARSFLGSTSVLGDRLLRLRRTLSSGRVRAIALVAGACALYLWFALLPGLPHCGGGRGGFSYGNLRTICLHWESIVSSAPLGASIPSPLTLPYLRPSFSDLSDRARVDARFNWLELTTRNKVNPFIAALFLAALAGLTRRWWRRLLGAAGLACLLFSLCCLFRTPIADALWPPNFAYLNDYVIAPGIDWGRTTSLDRSIIAYARMPDIYGWRVVAFQDWKVDAIPEAEFLALAPEQGIDPNPP